MISVATVSYGKYPDEHIDNLVESIVKKSSEIKEIIVIHGFEPEEFYKEDSVGGIKIKHIAPPRENIVHMPKGSKRIFSFKNSKYEEHSFAMHKAIEHTTEPYLIMTDPDIVFFMKKFDKMYLDIYQKYNLNIIGVCHYEAASPFWQEFPTIINCLIKKEKLPDKNWMKGKIKARPYLGGWRIEDFVLKTKIPDDWPIIDGHYLYPSAIPERYKEFPNTNCWFQTGANLYLWDKDNGSRSATFKCDADGIAYYTNHIVSTIPEFNEKPKRQLLLKHVKGWQKNKKESAEECRKWNKESTTKKLFT